MAADAKMGKVARTLYELKYEQPRLLLDAIEEINRYFTDFSCETSKYVFQDGTAFRLLCVHINLPVPNVGKSVPLKIWLPLEFPRSEPIVHLARTGSMLVNPYGNILGNNQVENSYLQEWNEKLSNLADLLQCLIIEFTSEFPAFELCHFSDWCLVRDDLTAVLAHYSHLKMMWLRTNDMEVMLTLGGRIMLRGQYIEVRISLPSGYPSVAPNVTINNSATKGQQESLYKNLIPNNIKKWQHPNSTIYNLLEVLVAEFSTDIDGHDENEDVDELDSFIKSASLPENIKRVLKDNGFCSRKSLQCLKEEDLGKLNLNLADTVTLRESLKTLRISDKENNKNPGRRPSTTGNTGCTVSQMFSRGLRHLLEGMIVTEEELTIQNEIARGFYGVVYKGKLKRHNSPSEVVAVKTVKISNSSSEEQVEAFIAEMLQMTKLHHRNILEVKALAILEEKPFLVLPYMHNGSLLDYIKKPNRWLSVRDLLRLGLDVANGMKYLNDQHIVHCDLAARNCLVDDNITVKIGDFGLVRQLHFSEWESITSRSPLAVRWAAPEILIKHKLTLRSDVWSFGILLWELMTEGETPYLNYTSNKTVIAKIIEGYRLQCPLSTPRLVRKIMIQCWEMDATKRPSFQDIISCLEHEVSTTKSCDSSELSRCFADSQVPMPPLN